jgi:MYXO-CTERM domain-containing protein
MKIQSKISLSVIFATSSLLMASGNPAKAIPPACADGPLSTILSAPSCTDALGFTFKLTSFTNFLPTDIFSFQSAGQNFQYSLQGSSAWSAAGNPYALNYTVTPPSGLQLTSYRSALSSANSAADKGTFDIKSITLGTDAIATFGPNFSAQGAQTFNIPPLSSDTYSAILNVTGGTIASVTASVSNDPTPPPSSGVPGPLPLLGLGAAFGFSRRLRRRIATNG